MFLQDLYDKIYQENMDKKERDTAKEEYQEKLNLMRLILKCITRHNKRHHTIVVIPPEYRVGVLSYNYHYTGDYDPVSDDINYS